MSDRAEELADEMTEQKRAAALADRIERDDPVVLHHGDEDQRLIVAALRAHATPTTSANSSTGALAEIEWIILGCSQVEHKPSWVADAALAIVERISSVQAAALSAAVDPKLCEMRSQGDVFTLGQVGDLVQAAHDKGAETRLTPPLAEVREVVRNAAADTIRRYWEDDSIEHDPWAISDAVLSALTAAGYEIRPRGAIPVLSDEQVEAANAAWQRQSTDDADEYMRSLRPIRAGDDLGNGRVAVPAASIRAVLDTVQEMRPGQIWTAHSTDNFAGLRAMLAAAKEG